MDLAGTTYRGVIRLENPPESLAAEVLNLLLPFLRVRLQLGAKPGSENTELSIRGDETDLPFVRLFRERRPDVQGGRHLFRTSFRVTLLVLPFVADAGPKTIAAQLTVQDPTTGVGSRVNLTWNWFVCVGSAVVSNLQFRGRLSSSEDLEKLKCPIEIMDQHFRIANVIHHLDVIPTPKCIETYFANVKEKLGPYLARVIVGSVGANWRLDTHPNNVRLIAPWPADPELGIAHSALRLENGPNSSRKRIHSSVPCGRSETVDRRREGCGRQQRNARCGKQKSDESRGNLGERGTRRSAMRQIP
jgi:hypothetical protein